MHLLPSFTSPVNPASPVGASFPRRCLAGVAAALCGLVLSLSLGSCGLLEQLDVGNLNGAQTVPPTVQASELALRKRPTISQLAAYYCPTVIDDFTLRLTCGLVLGAPPPTSQLSFDFGINITIQNPNQVPIPALDILLALTLFEGQGAEALGAVCISMCSTQDATCDGTPKPGACQSTQKDIHTLDDFVARVPSLIGALVSGRAEQELRKSLVAAAGNVKLDLAFHLGIDQALRVFEKAITQVVRDLLLGKTPTLSVPVAATGTVFFDIPVVGRLGVNYGPLHSSWQIDSTLLN